MTLTVDDFRRPNADGCDADGCNSGARSTHIALCEMHYGRVRRTGRLNRTTREPTGECLQCGSTVSNNRVTCGKRCATRLARGNSEDPFECALCGVTRKGRSDAIYCSSKCSSRAAHLRHHYGMTVPEYKELIDRQGNRCAICGETFSDKVHVDHDHETGRVRGLLCGLCNPMLGLMRDDVEVARSAINYLTSSRPGRDRK